ncbi:MAG: PAC2 family protein [Anaerolineae bacterium]
MNEVLELWETPQADEIHMIAGWRQWADAGSISSMLPTYLVNQLKARKIGRIRPDGFYLFQIPGTHQFLRPEIKLEDGYRTELRKPNNDIYYVENNGKGLVIFLGDEPHMNVDRYAETFFQMTQALGVERIASLGGVFGPVPYDAERQVTAAYSLPRMREDLECCAVLFSNYEGGVSLGSYLADKAEEEEVEYFTLYGLVPLYDFSELSPRLEAFGIDQDYRAWYDVMRRVIYLFGLDVDLSDLEYRSQKLAVTCAEEIQELMEKAPQAHIDVYLDKVRAEFEPKPFAPLDELWGRELGDIFENMDL